MKTILVTGGAGYIGSHTLIELSAHDFGVVVIDNLVNASAESLRRVEKITNTTIPFIQADVRDQAVLDDVFTTHSIDAVIHFAGLKAVGESVTKPLEYYDNNLVSTLALLEAMRKHTVNKLVFSSSATVYGTPSELPLRETSQTGIGITNPYGWTKYMIEQIIRDYSAAQTDFQATILRYFNPIGAHESGMIGEDPNGIPNNLLPYVAQVAVGKLASVGVFGNDYDTPDGTGVRDYSEACGKNLPYEIKPRRAGDIAACYADCGKAEHKLGWRAELTIKDACRDSWRWQSQNPNGYSS